MALVTEEVFGRLLQLILAGTYAPGDKLPKQRDLAADLGVTLGSLREALKRLEQMGLVDVRHGDATRVRDWRRFASLDVLAHLVLGTGRLDVGLIEHVLDARAMLLREIAGLAAERRDDAQAKRLHVQAASFGDRAEEDDAVAAAHVDFAFMTEVADAAGNLVYVLVLNAIRDAYFDHVHLVPVTARPLELAPLYVDLATAIEQQDTVQARDLAGELAGRHRDRVLAAVRER